MTVRMPVAFVAHGAPDALLKAPDAVACWQELGRTLPAPKAILVVSAHWQARHPTASLSGAPETLHDFSGFCAGAASHAISRPGRAQAGGAGGCADRRGGHGAGRGSPSAGTSGSAAMTA